MALPPQSLFAGRHLKRCSGWLALLWYLLVSPMVFSESRPPTEYDVKAAMLLNFAKFVDWPPGKLGPETNPVVIGILGRDPFGAVLDDLAQNQEVAGHRLEIRRLTQSDMATNCHVVFITGTAPETDKLMALTKQAGVVLVSDTETFTRQGGHISLYIQDNKVRFEVNLAAFERSGLKMHSQVLKLAPRVSRDGKDVKK